jgi:hypothetical protein
MYVCNHIVFSHVVAMRNYLLPSPPVRRQRQPQRDGSSLEGATLQKPTGLESIRGWEDWQLAFVAESGCIPKTGPIG